MNQTDLYRRGDLIFIDSVNRRLFFREAEIVGGSGSPHGVEPEMCSILIANHGWVFDVPISWKRLADFIARK